MMRPFYLRMMLSLLLGFATLSGLANAQIYHRSMLRGLGKGDITTVQPIIRDMLEQEQPGGRRPWHSPSGNHGEITLLEGGTRAGLSTGRVRISLTGKNRRAQTIVFRYQRDAHGVWRTIG